MRFKLKESIEAFPGRNPITNTNTISIIEQAVDIACRCYPKYQEYIRAIRFASLKMQNINAFYHPMFTEGKLIVELTDWDKSDQAIVINPFLEQFGSHKLLKIVLHEIGHCIAFNRAMIIAKQSSNKYEAEMIMDKIYDDDGGHTPYWRSVLRKLLHEAGITDQRATSSDFISIDQVIAEFEQAKVFLLCPACRAFQGVYGDEHISDIKPFCECGFILPRIVIDDPIDVSNLKIIGIEAAKMRHRSSNKRR